MPGRCSERQVLHLILFGGARSAAKNAGAYTSSMPGDTITLPVRDTLAALAVQDERRDGHTRDKFRHWTDARRDDCGTHAEVLVEEAVDPPTVGANCKLSGGIWYSHYDDQYLASARKADVDHLVPLAEAWESGASTWTPKEREAYANDLDDPRADLSISGLQPLEGQPEAAAVSGLPLQYITAWVADKTRYRLSVDADEHAALASSLSRCPDVPITVS